MFVQIIGFVGTALFFASYQCKSNKNLFRVQFLSYSCYTTHLLLLGAITGGIAEAFYGVPEEIAQAAKDRTPPELAAVLERFEKRDQNQKG